MSGDIKRVFVSDLIAENLLLRTACDEGFIITHYLIDAYNAAETNEDCANILRLYCREPCEFMKKYAPHSNITARIIEKEKSDGCKGN